MAELSFKIDIDGNGFAKVKKLSGDLKKSDKQAKALGESLKKASRGIAIAGGAILTAGGAIALLTKQTMEQIDASTKASRAVGIQTELYTGLIHVMDLGGVSQESMNSSLKRFARNINDASNGIGTGKRAFEQLGISIKNSEGELKSQEQLLLEVADNFQKMENGASKTAIAQDIFGRSGADLINVLNGGSKAMQEQLKSAEALGVVFDEKLGAKVEYFNDRLTEVATSIKGFRIQFVSAFSDSNLFDGFIGMFKLLSKTISNFIQSEQFTKYLDHIHNALKSMVQPVTAVIVTFKALSKILWNMGQIVIDGLVGSFDMLTSLIAETGASLMAFFRGDWAGAVKIAEDSTAKIQKAMENLGSATDTNLNDIMDAVTGLEDDYVSMASSITEALNSTGSASQGFQFQNKEMTDAIVDQNKKAKESFSNYAESIIDTQLKINEEFHAMQANEFDLKREKEIEEHQKRMELIRGLDLEEAQQKELHKARLAEIDKAEADAKAKLDEARIRNNWAVATSYAESASRSITAMSLFFSKNKKLAQASILAQGAVAFMNAWTLLPNIPLATATAFLATAQTYSALDQLSKAKAFVTGGVIGGGEQFVRVNERGGGRPESILNSSATATLGAGTIDAINNGRFDVLEQKFSNSRPSININVNGVLTQEFYEETIKPMAEMDRFLS